MKSLPVVVSFSSIMLKNISTCDEEIFMILASVSSVSSVSAVVVYPHLKQEQVKHYVSGV